MSNNEETITYMIEFIEKKERELYSKKTMTTTQKKADAVKAILTELENVMKDEN